MKRNYGITLLAMLISTSSFAAQHALNNDNISLTFDDQKQLTTIKDSRSGSQLSTQELFSLTLPDGKLLHAADFTLAQTQQQGDTLLLDYTRPDFNVSVKLALLKGKYASVGYTLTSVGQSRNVAKFTFFPVKAQGTRVDGTLTSSPIVSDAFYLLPDKPIVKTTASATAASLSIDIKTPIHPDIASSYGVYLGTYPDASQLRRSVNLFINAVRPRPYKPFLHYNSWMDIGYFTPYTEQDVLTRMDEWNKALIAGRGIKLDAFVLDDGWDDKTGRWLFSPSFSNGFSTVLDKAASIGSSVGLWLSPFGGYGKPREERVSHADEYGFETQNGLFALSGPNYFKNFNEQIQNLINNEHITSFKLDGMGNAGSYIPGSQFASDFDASITLLNNMRKANPNQYINVTTGTYASPSWLFYADSIWRGGIDMDVFGPGTAVQRWLTYRDKTTYENVVKKGPLFPINSLMYHGIISAQKGYKGMEKVQSDGDFADQVWSYFATGTQLQELYITPSMLNDAKWDTLADAAKWSKANADVLVDTHWVGGSPGDLQVYGWGSWSKAKSIIGLRNPSDKPQTYLLNLKTALEIPAGEASTFTLKPVYGSNDTVPQSYDAPVPVTLKPFETLVWEATPAR